MAFGARRVRPDLMQGSLGEQGSMYHEPKVEKKPDRRHCGDHHLGDQVRDDEAENADHHLRANSHQQSREDAGIPGGA